MTDRYAVVGNPVVHSLSPRIHAAFAAATGQDIAYDLLPAPTDGFAATVEAFFAGGGAGLNVTLPFKAEAARWVAELDPAARSAGAVNTIVRANGVWRGHNTDGPGLVRDLLVNCGVRVAGARLLLVGAGGAASGVIGPLLAEQPERLIIANRTPERAHALAAIAHAAAPRGNTRGMSLAEVTGPFDVVVNATSAGLGGGSAVPDLPPAAVRDAVCYDMVYSRSGDTTFCRWAAAQRASRVLDGLGMLVEQAALAFELWRGMRPPTAPVLELLRRVDV